MFCKVLSTFENIIWKMEHLLQKIMEDRAFSKCSIFHNIFKYMIFQRPQKHDISKLSKGVIME